METDPVTARELRDAMESTVDGVAAQQIAVLVIMVPGEMAHKVVTQAEVPGAMKIAAAITRVPRIAAITDMSLPIETAEDTLVAADMATDLTLVPGITVTAAMNSPIAADEDTAVVVDTATDITQVPDTTVTTDMSLPVVADVAPAVAVDTVMGITLVPDIMVNAVMNSPIAADEDTAVEVDTVMDITQVPGIMVNAVMSSPIAADVDMAVTVDTGMTITPHLGIMDMTGTSSPTVELRIIAATASLATVTTRRDHTLVLITLIRDMSSLMAAAGDAAAEALDIRLDGVARAPVPTSTTLVLATTMVKRLGIRVLPRTGLVALAALRLVLQVPDGQVSVDRALVVRVLPGRSSRSICWGAPTRTKTAS